MRNYLVKTGNYEFSNHFINMRLAYYQGQLPSYTSGAPQRKSAGALALASRRRADGMLRAIRPLVEVREVVEAARSA